MGGHPDREAPFFFTKPPDALVPGGGTMGYPPGTTDLQHEVELVVALGSGGSFLATEQARELIFGYAVGLDLTRRDLQREAKASGRPWDMAKAFDRSAPCSALVRAREAGGLQSGAIGLSVNGSTRQMGDLGDMIWSPVETVAHLSRLVALQPGDLVFTGTPEGVGPLVPGDAYRAWIEGVGELEGRIRASGSQASIETDRGV
jgi:fumarylpyruvate hydrolase